MHRSSSMQNVIRVVLFDFGGVIAEEGFFQGIVALGRKNGLDPEVFYRTVDRLIYETGYLTGLSEEATFWNAVREKTGVTGSDSEFKDEILKRFVIRPRMIKTVDHLRTKGLKVAMLSDQTDWLEEIDHQTGLYRHFDIVFNSFRIHKSKRDASVFLDVCTALDRKPEETLFVDDNINHIKRAQGHGLQTIHFTGMDEYEKQIERLRGEGLLGV